MKPQFTERGNFTDGDWQQIEPGLGGDETYIGIPHGPVVAGVWPMGDDDAGTDEQRANTALLSAAKNMRMALWYLGGGSVYLEQCGRLCWCPNRGTSSDDNRHSTACCEAWKAFLKSEGR